ncbi:alpha/beta hydrolase [Marivita sp. S6314]|nr:alpha/beta hydrolase [Marivita sp. S6314]
MIYSFADSEIDVDAHTLRRGGQEVHVEPQVFDVLHLLVSHAGDMVSYDTLIDVVWDGRIVSDATVAARISAARAAVGDTGRTQDIIQTIARRGIKLIVPVHAHDTDPQNSPTTGVPTQTIRMTTSQDGSVLAWSSLGKGTPLLRAGHWLTHLEKDLTSSIWGPWIDRLSSRHQLVRYDPRGTGMSARDCGAISVRNGVEDMLAVADAARLERFSILASSQSAAIAFHFAARFPDRVDKIVTCGAFIQGSCVRDPASGNVMTDALAVMIKEGWGNPDSGYMRSVGTLFMPSATDGELSDILELQAASASSERAIEIRTCCAYYDEIPVLARVGVPVLVAHAINDSVHPFGQAQLIASHLPDARLLPLETTNHLMSPREAAFDVFMTALEAFLE